MHTFVINTYHRGLTERGGGGGGGGLDWLYNSIFPFNCQWVLLVIEDFFSVKAF